MATSRAFSIFFLDRLTLMSSCTSYSVLMGPQWQLRNVVDSSYVVYLQPLIAHKVYLVCVYRTKYLVTMAMVSMELFMLLCTLSLKC